MRKRLKNDVVLTDSQGNKTLALIGEQVWIELDPTVDKFRIYSFYTRKCIGVVDNVQAEKDFCDPDELKDYKKTHSPIQERKHGSGKDRRVITALLILLLPLWGIAQEYSPVKLSVVPIKIAADVYEIQATFDIEPGWWVYRPNVHTNCGKPTSIKVQYDSEAVIQLDEFDIAVFHNGDFDQRCGADRYYISYTALAPFKILTRRITDLNVFVTFQPYSEHGPHLVRDYRVSIPIHRDLPTNGEVITTPEGEGIILGRVPDICARVWWCIRHPFNKPYWKP